MYVIGLLILVFLIVALLGRNKSPYARVIIGSVFGVGFLILWPYFLFYTKLYSLSEVHIQVTYLVLCVSSTLLAIALAKLRFALPVAIVSFSTFAVVAILSFTLEVNIKNFIALQTGYFNQPVIKLDNVPPSTDSVSFTHPAGFEFIMPTQWQLQTDKGELFPYFQIKDGNSVVAELRPTCFDKELTVLSDVVQNIQHQHEHDDKNTLTPYCYHEAETEITCRVSQATSANQVTRTHWIAIRGEITKGVNLDFVQYRKQAIPEKEMHTILSSLRAAKGIKTPAQCLGISDWF